MTSSAAANTTEKAVKVGVAQKAATASTAPAATPAVQSSSALRIEAPTLSSRLPPASVPSVPADGVGSEAGNEYGDGPKRERLPAL